MRNREARVLTGLLVLYALGLCTVLQILPLWLDEVLQIVCIRAPGFSDLLRAIANNAGAVPLGYLTQQVTVDLLGLSTFSARISSVVFSLLSGLGVYLLARRLPLRNRILPVAIFALVPLQVRYAVEARPYEQALCLSIWSSVAFFRLVDRSSVWSAGLYFALVVAGLYTQPFSIFIPVGHCAWALLSSGRSGSRTPFVGTFLAIVLSIGAFIPWHIYASSIWQGALASERYFFSFKTLMLILKELVGSGYIGTGLMAILSVYGIARIDRKLFWALILLLPIVLALIVDAAFGYFFAIRQVLFSLPALALLAALGIERTGERHRVIEKALMTAVAVTLLAGNVAYFTRPREDWNAATDKIMSNINPETCVLFYPEQSAELYEAFDHGVLSNRCDPSTKSKFPRLVVAVSPYHSATPLDDVQRLLQREFVELRRTDFNGPWVIEYARRGTD